MRHWIILLIALSTPFLASATHFDDLAGYWDNFETQKTIKIKCKRYGIKIKGLYRRGRWTKFRQYDLGRYQDDSGNEIRVRNAYSIEFINRYSGHIVPFVRQGYQDFYSPRRNEKYKIARAPKSRNKNKRYYTGEHHDTSPSTPYAEVWTDRILQQIEGTYAPEIDLSRKVMILNTRDGIRVKELNTGKWYRYLLSEDRKAAKDKNGNSYILSSGELYWKGANGKTIRLSKITDRTD